MRQKNARIWLEDDYIHIEMDDQPPVRIRAEEPRYDWIYLVAIFSAVTALNLIIWCLAL